VQLDYIANSTFARVHRDPNRYIFVKGPVGCLPPESEFLTPGGWKKISEYDAKRDLVAQWHPEIQHINFVKPQAYIKVPAEQPLFHIYNANTVDMVLSPDHRVPYYDWRGVFHECSAQHIADKIAQGTEGLKYRIPTTIKLSINQPGINLSEPDLRLMVAVHAEGLFTEASTNSCVMRFRYSYKLERVKHLLTLAERSWEAHTNQHGEHVITFQAPLRSKQYGPVWWTITQAQAQIIFDELKYWGDNYLRYHSPHKRDADFIQFVAHTLGHHATISHVEHSYVVSVTLLTGDSTTFHNCSCETVSSTDGFQYCFTVPTSYFVARHNNKIFVTGNSGKTSGCIMHLFMNAMRQPIIVDNIRQSRYAILRSTYPAIKTTVVKSWKEWFQNLIKIVYDVPIRGEIRLPLADGTEMHMELFFIALDREEEVNKLQSFQLTGAHMNEAAEMPQQVHQMLKSRINRFPLKKKQNIQPVSPFIICDYNSVDTEHWLYKLAEENKPANHSFYSQPPALLICHEREGFVCDNDGNWYKLNPDADNIENLSEEYYQDMVSGADADWVNVFILNNYGMARQGKPVFPSYNDTLHCSPHLIKPMPALPLIIGVDCGLTPAAAFCQLTPTGQLVVIDEIVTEDTSIDSFAHNYLWPKIKTNYANFRFMLIVDPASTTRSENDKKSAFDILKRAGFPIRTAKTNNGLARREAVNYFLHKLNGKEPGFLLSSNCTILRKGFISEYRYGKILTSARVGDRFKETPDKNIFSHVHDALQYAALELSEGRVFKKMSRRVPKQRYHGPADSMGGY